MLFDYTTGPKLNFMFLFSSVRKNIEKSFLIYLEQKSIGYQSWKNIILTCQYFHGVLLFLVGWLKEISSFRLAILHCIGDSDFHGIVRSKFQEVASELQMVTRQRSAIAASWSHNYWRRHQRNIVNRAPNSTTRFFHSYLGCNQIGRQTFSSCCTMCWSAIPL